MGIFDFLRKKDSKQIFNSATVVDRLEELGYFKYAAVEDITEIKKEVKTSLNEHFLSSTYFDDSPYNSKDYRHYHLDGEDLFEESGFLWQLNAMKSLFKKMNFELEISNHVEDWDKETGLNHSIILNNKNYIIFRNFNDFGWGEAAQRFAEIINDQLELQEKDERFFLVNGGNDGRAVYLTEEQFLLLDPILKDVRDRPLGIEDWCRVMQVDRNNYNKDQIPLPTGSDVEHFSGLRISN